jgi:hypothetical protein
MPREPILSRHRLPQNYRIALVGLWITPVCLFMLAVLLSRGLTASLLDPRFLLPLSLMLIPALYVWREGVDVLPSGIIARMHWPRYYPYTALDNWYFDSRADRRTLTVWDTSNRKVLECRAGHLSQLPMLLSALKANLRPRNWPS